MKAYGRNLRWIEDHQYGEDLHTKICIPSSGKKREKRRRRYERPFKQSERQYAKHQSRKTLKGVDD